MNNVQTYVLFAFVLLIIIAAVRTWFTKHRKRGIAIVDQSTVSEPGKKKVAVIYSAPVTGTKYPRTRSMTPAELEARGRLRCAEFWRRFLNGGRYED